MRAPPGETSRFPLPVTTLWMACLLACGADPVTSGGTDASSPEDVPAVAEYGWNWDFGITLDPGQEPAGPVTDEGTAVGDNPLDNQTTAGQCPPVGAAIFCEMMPNPGAVNDADGEYLEICNLTGEDLDLSGWEIRSGDTESHEIAGGGPVVLAAHGTLLAARSGDPASNGGFVPDYVYTKINLSNGADDLALWCGGTLLDAVAWDTAGDWIVSKGHALQLDPGGFNPVRNDSAAWWCPGFASFGDGDMGSPGTVNLPCGTATCGDAFQQAWESCEDHNGMSGDGCSALCQEEHFEPGWVVVTEIMYDPAAVNDSKGEYLEVHNTTAQAIDLAGWRLKDDNNDDTRIEPEGGSLLIPAGGLVVMGRHEPPGENGGVDLDYRYTGFTLGQSDDRVILEWNGTVIDRVDYDPGVTFPAAKGRSLNLDRWSLDAVSNDSGAHWCPTGDGYPLPMGDFGTPGELNEVCPTP